jgi:hypothetical protein
MNSALQALIAQFNDNMGNRITTALANGILLEVDKAIKVAEPKPAEESPAPDAQTA